MKKEDLVAMGLTEEQATKVMESLDGSYIPKTRFNEVNEENKVMKQSIADRDTQLETLKKSVGDNEALKTEIATLQESNKTAKATHEAEIKQLKINNAVEQALTGAKALNTKAVKALLDLEKSELDDTGAIKGLKEQIEKLKASDDSKFLFASGAPKMRGAKLGESEDGDTLGDAQKNEAVTFAKGLATKTQSGGSDKANDYYFSQGGK